MLNAISVDVEEYFHAANLAHRISRKTWHSIPSRVEYATDKILQLFDTYTVHGTFFILGWTARRHRSLVKKIADAGHEIASHGYQHKLVYEQKPSSFYRDIHITKQLLEDITGFEVKGYRAPNFSITDKSPWAYETLARAGYSYDSSRYPVRHPRYNNVAKSLNPELIHTEFGPIWTLPLAVCPLRILGKQCNLPVAGGAYWRLFPSTFCTWGLRRINTVEGKPFICYFHPWELDPEQPRVQGLKFLTNIRHYGGVSRFESTLHHFLSSFSFGSISEMGDWIV